VPEKFFDFVRGATDIIPEGYAEPGLRAYRHLVFLGVSQILEAHFRRCVSNLLTPNGNFCWPPSSGDRPGHPIFTAIWCQHSLPISRMKADMPLASPALTPRRIAQKQSCQ
jgi:hypothetical protein